jgi:hypothetical protein
MLRWGIGAVLHQAMLAAERLPAIYQEFAQRLAPGDVVVSLNYDRVLKDMLELLEKPYRRYPYHYARCDAGFERDRQHGAVPNAPAPPTSTPSAKRYTPRSRAAPPPEPRQCCRP